jgi:NADP-dependent 3-hydroxy acid dehydrogenase YdfG
MEKIKDKVVVITGASSGIGEAAAVMLAERGAKVVLGARGLDRLEALARRIAGAGGEVAYAQTDVRRREDLTSLVNLACERYGYTALTDFAAARITSSTRSGWESIGTWLLSNS